MDEPIYVTRPSLPPLGELLPMLEEIWENRILTNNGPFHLRLEEELSRFLDVDRILLATNGMLALTMAIDAAALKGEVITTPYSFVATAHAIKAAGLEPIFVDVRTSDLNIDPGAIESAITPQTSAIVAVHCYGNPCQLDAIEDLARRHQLKVIYDAAHAFGVKFNGRSLVDEGDLAAISFHATKAFNTFEGGAVVVHDPETEQSIRHLRNFGIDDEVTISTIGMNAKMNEFCAALGLLQLTRFEGDRSLRRMVDARYRIHLQDIHGISPLPLRDDLESNYSYFPILVTDPYPLTRDGLYDRLRDSGIFSRRYFYPLLSNLPMYNGRASAQVSNLPVANKAASEILCLPIYPDLAERDQMRVIDLIREPVS